MEEHYFADITNILHEAGILKAKEKIIDVLDDCPLLERTTEKGYSYRLANPTTLKTRYLFSRKTTLPQDRYIKVREVISQWEDSHQPSSLLSMSDEQRAEALLIETFINILPQHEMNYRAQQVDLSIKMLEALTSKMIALCEAEVGTGKTHAYILAIAIHNLFIEDRKSTIISTSTIALQKALIGDYLPQISQILMEHRITNKPLDFVVRKGKGHYICDKKLYSYRRSLIANVANKEIISLLDDLLSESSAIDLDDVLASSHVKRQIAVSHCDKECSNYLFCRYQLFLHKCQTNYYDFQITNHNYLIADILTHTNLSLKPE